MPPPDPVCWATGGALDWLYPNFYLKKQQEEQENQAKSNNTTTKQPTKQTREGKVANEVQVPPTRLRSAWDIQPHCTCMTIPSTSRRGGALDWLYPTFYFNKQGRTKHNKQTQNNTNKQNTERRQDNDNSMGKKHSKTRHGHGVLACCKIRQGPTIRTTAR